MSFQWLELASEILLVETLYRLAFSAFEVQYSGDGPDDSSWGDLNLCMGVMLGGVFGPWKAAQNH